ncbi:MAG: anaerobic ribonucleoside-triphosphate reductase activating protein [Opitutales bacterium]
MKESIPIGGYTPLSLIDFPGHTASVVFTQGCPLSCFYCHNPSLTQIRDRSELIPESNIWNHLEKRSKMLDGVVITGGEPLAHRGIGKFINQCTGYNLRVKLDTSGVFSSRLRSLIQTEEIDYIAMDVKTGLSRYSQLTGCPIDPEKILGSIQAIQESGIDHEFRTTVVPDWHSEKDLESVAQCVYPSPLVLQEVRPTPRMQKQGYPEKSAQRVAIRDCAETLTQKGFKVRVR